MISCLSREWQRESHRKLEVLSSFLTVVFCVLALLLCFPSLSFTRFLSCQCAFAVKFSSHHPRMRKNLAALRICPLPHENAEKSFLSKHHLTQEQQGIRNKRSEKSKNEKASSARRECVTQPVGFSQQPFLSNYSSALSTKRASDRRTRAEINSLERRANG